MPLMRLLEKILSSFLCGFENFLKSWWWWQWGTNYPCKEAQRYKCVLYNSRDLIRLSIGSSGRILWYTALLSHTCENSPLLPWRINAAHIEHSLCIIACLWKKWQNNFYYHSYIYGWQYIVSWV